MRFLAAITLGCAALAAGFSIPAHARSGPDCVYASPVDCVSREQAVGPVRPQKVARIAKIRAVRHADRSIFTYAIDAQNNVVGFNSGSASCLPPEIKRRLAEVETRFGKVAIVSTFRKGARIAGSGQPSYHASCRAVDFKVRGNQAAAAAWLKSTHAGGVGTYSCAMHHIHIDNGPRYRWHQCVNANGRPVKRRS